ncbi:MAG: hypothetical protein ACF788_10505, partial [Novipirellula sp. JB048]
RQRLRDELNVLSIGGRIESAGQAKEAQAKEAQEEEAQEEEGPTKKAAQQAKGPQGGVEQEQG